MQINANSRAEKWVAGSVIIAALALIGMFIIPEVRRWVGLDGDSAPQLEFGKIDVLKQSVNQIRRMQDAPPTMTPDIWNYLEQGVERATFRFVVTNHGPKAALVTGGTILVGNVPVIDLGSAAKTAKIVNLMDHNGHTQVFVSSPRMGDAIPVDIRTTIEPESSKEFVLWFRSNDPVDLIIFDARFRLHFGKHSITSDEFRAEIHTETNEFPIFDASGRDGV